MNDHLDKPRPEQDQKKLVPSDDEVMETRRVVEEIRKSNTRTRMSPGAISEPAPTHAGSH